MSQHNARCSRYSYYDQSYASVIFHNLLNSNHKGMSTLGEGVLLGILGGGVLPSSLNPHSISDQKNVISHTRFQTWPLRNMHFAFFMTQARSAQAINRWEKMRICYLQYRQKNYTNKTFIVWLPVCQCDAEVLKTGHCVWLKVACILLLLVLEKKLQMAKKLVKMISWCRYVCYHIC